MYAACMNAIRDSVQEQSCVVHSLPCALSASDSPNMTAAPSQQHDNVRMSMHSQACTCMSASVRHFGSAHQANTFWRCSVLTTYMVFRPSALLSGACQHTRRSQSHTAYTQDHLSVWAAAAILPQDIRLHAPLTSARRTNSVNTIPRPGKDHGLRRAHMVCHA